MTRLSCWIDCSDGRRRTLANWSSLFAHQSSCLSGLREVERTDSRKRWAAKGWAFRSSREALKACYREGLPLAWTWQGFHYHCPTIQGLGSLAGGTHPLCFRIDLDLSSAFFGCLRSLESPAMADIPSPSAALLHQHELDQSLMASCWPVSLHLLAYSDWSEIEAVSCLGSFSRDQMPCSWCWLDLAFGSKSRLLLF